VGRKGSRQINPIRLIDSIYKRQTGTSLVLALAISAFFVVGAITFLAPLILVGAAIAAFGLDREPSSWIGSVLIVVGFVAGVVGTALAWRWLVRLSRPLLALTDALDEAPSSLDGPSPVPPPTTRPTSPSKLRELDARHAPAGSDDPSGVNASAAPIGGAEPPTQPRRPRSDSD
jgi:hypothetical protein